MKPLVVLLVSFGLIIMITALADPPADLILAGNVSMFLMLFFTAIGHFRYVEGMAMMIPKPVPYKREIIYITGLLEVIAGVMLLFPKTRDWAAFFLMGFFLIILPANIYAARNRIDYEKRTIEGAGTNYLWFRIPLQLLFILWVLYFSLYLPSTLPG